MIDGLTGDQRFFIGFAQVWRLQVPRRRTEESADRGSALARRISGQRHAAERRRRSTRRSA